MSERESVEVGGGYDKGYAACPMFWPNRPGSLLVALEQQNELRGGHALDAGCGEGTNAEWLADRGYEVEGVEVSGLALAHAEERYPNAGIKWTHDDVRTVEPSRHQHDLVIAYGLLHCIPERDMETVFSRLRGWTQAGGLLVVVAFNSRSQDLDRAHPGFHPTLQPHEFYLDAFSGWELLMATDSDLHESHPDTNIRHHHSMTRIVGRRP